MSRAAKTSLKVGGVVAILAVAVVLGVYIYAWACITGPVAILYPSEQTIFIDDDAFLDGSASYDASGYDITKYTFSFDDGGADYTETGASAPDGAFDGETTHTYAYADVFSVTLTIENENGLTGRSSSKALVNSIATAGTFARFMSSSGLLPSSSLMT